MANKKQILEVVKTLQGVYGKEPGDMSGFYWALEDCNYDTLLDVSKAWVQREKWMPAPSELRELCIKLEAQWKEEDEPRRIRQRVYLLFDKYREGEITLEQFRSDRGAQWAYKQHGIFSGLFEEND